MNALWTVALLAVAGYLISLHLHPYTKCGFCRRTPGRRHDRVFSYAFRQCPECGGKGRKLRVGVRVLLGRTDKT